MRKHLRQLDSLLHPCMRGGHLRILVEVVYPARVEGRGAPYDAVHLVAFREQQFSEVGAVLGGGGC